MFGYKVEFMTHDLGGRFTAYFDRLSQFEKGFYVNRDGIPDTSLSVGNVFVMPHMIKLVQVVND